MTNNNFTFLLNAKENSKNLSEYKINESTDIINVNANGVIDAINILYNEHYDRFNIQVFQKAFNEYYIDRYKWGIYIKHYNNDPWLIFIDDGRCGLYNLNSTDIYMYSDTNSIFDYLGEGHNTDYATDDENKIENTMVTSPDYTEKLTLTQFIIYTSFLNALTLCNGYHMENTMLIIFRDLSHGAQSAIRLEIDITDEICDKYTLLHKFE